MSDKVTHLVVHPTEDKLVPRTIKYLLALAKRSYIVSFEWIVDCIAANKIVDESNYLMAGDKIALGGPGEAVESRDQPPLFRGLSFYFHGSFTSPSRLELEKIVKFGGGTVKSKPPTLTSVDEVLDTKDLIIWHLFL